MNENTIIKEIKAKGIVRIENFLDYKNTNQFAKMMKFYSVPKGDPKSYFPTDYKKAFLKILTLNIPKFLHSLSILKIAKNKKLAQLTEKYFDKKTKLSFIDAYYSKVSNLEILPWHTDQAYSGKLDVSKFNNPNNYYLKIFIYLTDVGHNNGCMSYIPESHKIGYAIRKGIFERKIKYQPYWSINSFKKIILDNKDYFENYFKGGSILTNFLKKVEDLEILKTTKAYSYEAKAGSAIIFDEGGVHRGSKPQLNDRMVLRYMYSRKN